MFRDKSINDEGDLLYAFYNLRKNQYKEEVYPRVTSIPKGHKIVPDIDLLTLDKPHNTTAGYELKLLRKTDPYTPFYTGLGEAIHYFRHGIDSVSLVLGVLT